LPMRRGLGLVGSLRVVVARGLTAAAPAQRRAALLSAGLSFVAGAAYKHVDASACRCQQAPSMLAEADALFDSNRYDSLAKKLRGALAYAPGDAELNWRLGRACKKLADAEKNAKAREALTREGLACADRAVAADPQCGPAHKWYAIMLSGVGEFLGTSEKIKNSFVVREHFERATELSPNDATARHLLGLWCFEVAKLSWLEKKAAAALFASPPTATFDDALGHFEAAERMDPGFYPKNRLLLAMACAKVGRVEEARTWRERCLAAPARTPEDEQTLKEAAAFKP